MSQNMVFYPGGGGGGGEYNTRIWVGVFRQDPTTVTLFMTQKSKFVYPVYDTIM